MRKHDLVSGLISIILGIGVCVESIKLKIVLEEFHIPAAGFMPFLAGVIMGILGFILVCSSAWRGLRKDENVKDEKILVKEDWRKFVIPFLNILILFAYVLLLEPLGFLFTSFIFLFLLFKLSEPKRWMMPLILTISTVILSYLVFSVWLQCQFPKGIFGF